jgi:predicted RNase H-like nuclease (RuvC/YqgF family)
MKKNKLIHQTTIGIDPGDEKHAICALGKDGEVLQEFTIRNEAEALLD